MAETLGIQRNYGDGLGNGGGGDNHTLRGRLEARASAMRSERTSWEHDWRRVQTVCAPGLGRFSAQGKSRPSNRDRKALVNNAGRFGLRTLAAGMSAGLTSPAYPWFTFTVDDPALAELAGVRSWLDQVEAVMYRVLARSGFYDAMHGVYAELGAFGQAVLWHQDDFDNIAAWRVLTAGEYWLAADHRGRVDTCYREIEMTVRQVVERFGKDRCSQQVRDLWDNRAYDRPVLVRHLCQPNGPMFEGRKIQGKHVSVYWEVGTGGGYEDKLLELKGYQEQPFHAPRWDVCQPDVYGWAPAYDALGDALALQTLTKKIAKGIDVKVDPPLQGPQSFVHGVDRVPGAYNVTGNATQKIESIYDARTFSIVEAQQYGLALEQRVKEAFYADLFMMLSMSSRREITAREVDERHEEKMLQLGSVITRANHELLNPVLDRLFNQLVRASEGAWAQELDGVIPPPPDELAGEELKVEYVSSLQQAQRATRASPIYRLVEATGMLAALDPNAVKKLDSHQTLDKLAQMLGAPAGVLRDDETVAAMEQAEREAAQAQSQQEMLGGAAEAANKLGGAKMDGTALGAMMEQANSE